MSFAPTAKATLCRKDRSTCAVNTTAVALLLVPRSRGSRGLHPLVVIPRLETAMRQHTGRTSLCK